MDQHLTSPGVKVNSPSANSAQVRSGEGQPLFNQYVERGLTILGANAGFGATSGNSGEYVCAAEQFHCQFVAAGAKHLELLYQVTNAEVHIAVTFGKVATWGQNLRALRQDAVAHCAGAQPCAPESCPNARSQNRSEDGRTASQVEFSRLKIQVRQNWEKLDHRGFL
jgi:hypothetical protein